METKTEMKNISINSTRLKGFIENVKKVQFHQKKANDLTEFLLIQYADIISEAKCKERQKTR
jgi:hypothetical protein